MNTILFFLLIALSILFALINRIYANPHKNIILETTLPADKLTNPQVKNLTAQYKKRLLHFALIFSIASAGILFIPYDSLTLLFFLILLFLFLGSFYFLQLTYIKKMTLLKQENNWYLPVKPILIDTKLLLNKNQKMLSWFWLLPSGILTLIGSLVSFALDGFSAFSFLISAVSLGCFALFVFSYVQIQRVPVKALTSDSNINQQANDLFRHYWSVLVVLSAALLSPIAILPTVSIIISYESAMLLIYSYLFLLLVYISFIFFYLFDLRKKQDSLLVQAKDYRYTDDDPFWRYGIYLNPNDSRLFVPDRIGMNISLNLGKLSGKLLVGGLGLVAVAAMFFSTLPILMNDFSKNAFSLETDSAGIKLAAPLTKTQKIQWKDIEDIRLVDTLPSKQIRLFGTATENYLSGEFNLDNQKAYLLVYKKAHKIIQIETKGKSYYFTTKEDTQTTEKFQEIQTDFSSRR